MVQHLQDLYYISGMLHLSEDTLSYINLIASTHCSRGYPTWTKNGNTIETSNDSGHYKYFVEGSFFKLGVIFSLLISLLLLRRSYSNLLFSMACIILLAIIYPMPDLLQIIHELTIKNAHHPTLRVLEFVLKFVCHTVVNIILIISALTLLLIIIDFGCFKFKDVHLIYSPILYTTITFLVLLLSQSITLYYTISVPESIPCYYCQFIPVCI